MATQTHTSGGVWVLGCIPMSPRCHAVQPIALKWCIFAVVCIASLRCDGKLECVHPVAAEVVARVLLAKAYIVQAISC